MNDDHDVMYGVLCNFFFDFIILPICSIRPIIVHHCVNLYIPIGRMPDTFQIRMHNVSALHFANSLV